MALRDKPIIIDDHNWYYEERKHISFVHKVVDANGIHLKTDIVKIPWKRVLESITRKYPSMFKKVKK